MPSLIKLEVGGQKWVFEGWKKSPVICSGNSGYSVTVQEKFLGVV